MTIDICLCVTVNVICSCGRVGFVNVDATHHVSQSHTHRVILLVPMESLITFVSGQSSVASWIYNFSLPHKYLV